MQAIIIKFLPATNTKPTRLKATCKGGSITMCISGGPDLALENRKVVHALCAKMGWTGVGLAFGTLPTGDAVAVITEIQHQK